MNQPQLESKLLVKITKEIKRSLLQHMVCKGLAHNLSTDDVLVTDDEIMAVADALKFNAFFVPTFVIMDAIELAKTERAKDEESEPKFWKR